MSVEVPRSSTPRPSIRQGTKTRPESLSSRSTIELIAAEIGAAEPGQVVLAAHVDVFEPAGRNAISIVDRLIASGPWRGETSGTYRREAREVVTNATTGRSSESAGPATEHGRTARRTLDFTRPTAAPTTIARGGRRSGILAWRRNGFAISFKLRLITSR